MAASATTVQQFVSGSGNFVTGTGDIVIHQSLSPAELQDRANLRLLLDKVKTFWIAGVLEGSLHRKALLLPGAQFSPEAVENAWAGVVELPGGTSRNISAQTSISDVFAEANRALLILGEAGAGKTMSLLTLARDLITRAEADSNLSQPIPIVLNLSSWSRRWLSLADWIVHELADKYHVPARFGRQWLQQSRLLPLLDGLDEVPAAWQLDCLRAINSFGQEHGLSGLAVCCRLDEYQRLPERLRLNAAICLKPLEPEQVNTYLEAAGPDLATLRAVMHADESLLALARSPLLLDVMSLAYRNLAPAALAEPGLDTVEQRRFHLFEAFIEYVFRSWGGQGQRYPRVQSLAWLRWLARQMLTHSQSVFQIEQLQPSWLPSRRQRWAYAILSRVAAGVLLGSMAGISLILLEVDVEYVVRTSRSASFWSYVVVWLAGLGLTVLGSLVVGISAGRHFDREVDDSRLQSTGANFTRNAARSILRTGLPPAIVLGLLLWIWSLVDPTSPEYRWMASILTIPVAMAIGLGYGVLFSSQGIGQHPAHDVPLVEALGWSWKMARRGGLVGLAIGGILGVGAGLSLVVAQQQGMWPPELETPNPALFAAVYLVLCSGIAGIGAAFIGAVAGGMAARRIPAKTLPNQGIRESARNAFRGSLVVTLAFATVMFLLLLPSQLPWWALVYAAAWGISLGSAAWLYFGGLAVIQHLTLRFLLLRAGCMPWQYARFLDEAADLMFLRKVGGGYIFLHRLLLEHFAVPPAPTRAAESKAA